MRKAELALLKLLMAKDTIYNANFLLSSYKKPMVLFNCKLINIYNLEKGIPCISYQLFIILGDKILQVTDTCKFWAGSHVACAWA